MSISRLSFREGEILDPNIDPREQVHEFMLQERGAISTLLPGEHNITPDEPYNRKALKYNYNLIVNQDGTALCRIIATSSDSKFKGIQNHGPRREIVSGVGGRMINLPEHQELLLIAARRPDGKAGLYEVIIYFPGPSPRLAL